VAEAAVMNLKIQVLMEALAVAVVVVRLLLEEQVILLQLLHHKEVTVAEMVLEVH
jgi:hypothetical protein